MTRNKKAGTVFPSTEVTADRFTDSISINQKKSIQVLVWRNYTPPHGTFPTPMFMPVGTQAPLRPNRQKNSRKWVLELSWPTPTISKPSRGRPGRKSRRTAPVHELGPAHLTDSGGFQVYSLADTRNITEEGVTFKITSTARRCSSLQKRPSPSKTI